MSSNLFHKIFGRQKGITREELGKYGSSDKNAYKVATEQKAAGDAFNADAMEGWEELNYDMTSLEKLDKNFLPKHPPIWIRPLIFGGVILLTVVTTVVVLNSTNGTPKIEVPIAQRTDEQEYKVEEADIIPATIELLEDAPEEKQIKVTTIKTDFQNKEQITPANDLPVAQLPLIELDLNKPKDLDIIKKHEYAKEIYLHDLKLIDYRNYRSKPEIKTKQMILSGLPANFEDTSKQDLDPVWKDIEIPYIEYIDKSMRIFASGNFKRALSRYETILETYPLDVNAHFYSGICYFNLNEHNLAIQHFDSCLDGPYSNFDEEALWMKALSLESTNRKEEAKKIFQKISNSKGFYSSQAATKLR